MKWQATALLLGLALGVGQPVSTVLVPAVVPTVTARAATTTEADLATGTYGSVDWVLTSEGVLHLSSGTLPDENPVPGTNMGQFAYQIALKLGMTTIQKAEDLQPVADLVTKVVLDGPIHAGESAVGLFGQLRNVTSYENLNQLDTSQTTDMSSMFHTLVADSVTTDLDVSSFDTSHVTKMTFMFYGQKSVKQLDVSNFDTSQVTNAMSMFFGDSALTELNFAKATFEKLFGTGTMFMFNGSGINILRLPKFAPPANFSPSSFFSGLPITELTLGPATTFNGGNPSLWNAQAIEDEYTGLWQAVGTGTAQNPLGEQFTTGKAVTDLYNTADKPTAVETYVWEPVNRVIEPTPPPVVTPPAVTVGQPVTVQYLDAQGKSLASNQVLTGNLGESYQANQLAFTGYKLTKTDGQASGTFTDQAQTVTFHYARDLQSGGDAATVAPIASVVYATKKIGLYQTKNFSKKTVKHWYHKQKRTNRPMFVVQGTALSKNGNLRYKVKDVNHTSKTAGKTGYITAKNSYVTSVYYASKHAQVKVIAKNGVNGYKQKSLKTKQLNYKQGKVLKIKKIVAYNKTTRFQLTNGKYVTANKKLVIAVP